MTLRNDMEKGRIEFENESDKELPFAREKRIREELIEAAVQYPWKHRVLTDTESIVEFTMSRITALEQALEIARRLLKEVTVAHRNPDDWAYNQCEQSPCKFCEDVSQMDAITQEGK